MAAADHSGHARYSLTVPEPVIGNYYSGTTTVVVQLKLRIQPYTWPLLQYNNCTHAQCFIICQTSFLEKGDYLPSTFVLQGWLNLAQEQLNYNSSQDMQFTLISCFTAQSWSNIRHIKISSPRLTIITTLKDEPQWNCNPHSNLARQETAPRGK